MYNFSVCLKLTQYWESTIFQLKKKRACLNAWVFFVVIHDSLWPSPSLLLCPQTWRLTVSLLNKLCWYYIETALIKVCMWWVRKRRAFKLTESGPVRKKKKGVIMTQGKEGGCKKPFGLSSINSDQGSSNVEAQGGELRTGFLPSLSMCSVLLV